MTKPSARKVRAALLGGARVLVRMALASGPCWCRLVALPRGEGRALRARVDLTGVPRELPWTAVLAVRVLERDRRA